MRFAQYAIYYEVCVENGMSDRLSQNEQGIIAIIPMLFDVYREVNPNGMDALKKKFGNVTKGGRKVSEQFLNQLTIDSQTRNRMLMQQQQLEAEAQAQADSTAPQGGDAIDQQSLFDQNSNPFQ